MVGNSKVESRKVLWVQKKSWVGEFDSNYMKSKDFHRSFYALLFITLKLCFFITWMTKIIIALKFERFLRKETCVFIQLSICYASVASVSVSLWTIQILVWIIVIENESVSSIITSFKGVCLVRNFFSKLISNN